jgi:hypothetical protein
VTKPVEKINALIARALSTTYPEEARTSAFVAVKLIRDHGVELVEVVAKPTPTSALERVVIRSRYAGTCRACGARYVEGDLVAWAPRRGAVHPRCTRQESTSQEKSQEKR